MPEQKYYHDGDTVPGIDVSSHQGRIDWAAVKAAGIKFAFIRDGDGLGEDSRFDYNFREAGKVGIRRGTYRYLRTQHDPRQQAAISHRMIENAGGFGMFDLGPAADIEWGNNDDSPNRTASPEKIVSTTKGYVEEIESLTGRRAIVYTGGYWRDRVAAIKPELAGALSDRPLWRAHWRTQAPNITPGWDRVTFWQWNERGHVDGIVPNVDQNVYFGSELDLLMFALWSQHWFRIAVPASLAVCGVLLIAGIYYGMNVT